MIALLAIFAAIGMVVATGAFTSVQAQRTVSVNVANDSAALLAMSPNGTANGQYATFDGDGALTINLDSNIGNGNADGVNPNATTSIGSVFDIQNQAPQEVKIYIEKSGGDTGRITLFQANDTGTSVPDTDSSTLTLTSGDKVAIGLSIDTTQSGGGVLGEDDSFNVELTVNAEDTSS